MTPWELAVRKSEHAEQRAVFAWANAAAVYGYWAADQVETYVKEHRETMFHSLNYEAKPIPELEFLYAIHNQGHGDAVRGGKAKAEGVKAGVPDMCLPVPRTAFSTLFHGLYIELKIVTTKEKRGVLSEKQKDKWIPFLKEQGYAVAVCQGWEEARTVLRQYLGESSNV